MKFKVLFLILSILIIVGSGCEDDELTIVEVLDETIKAVGEINATAFEMEMLQDLSMDGMDSFSTTATASGRAIEDPMMAEYQIEMEAAGLKFDMEMYLSDNLLYIEIPELGWVWEDITEEAMFAESYEDPFEFIDLLKNINPENVTMEADDDHYILSYKDATGELAALLKEEAEEQLGADLFGIFEIEEMDVEDMLGEIEFSELIYTVKIDTQNFLPVESEIGYNLAMEMMGEILDMRQEIKITYVEFDTFESIEVPDEVINEAVPLRDFF